MSGWATATLSELLLEARAGFACGEDPADGVFQFRMNNITNDGQLDLSKKRRVPRESRNIEEFLVEPGDVLFDATNSPDLVGKAAYFPGLEEPAVFSNHFLRLRPNPIGLEGRFLARWLNLQFQRGVFKGMCRQWVNQATVNRDSLLALRVPVPPLPEQRRIVEVLDKVDAVRAKRRSAIARLGALTQAIFLDMFGDPATNPKAWPRVSLGDLIFSASDGPHVSPKYEEQGVPFLSTRHVRAGAITWDDLKFISQADAEFHWRKCRPERGDILYTKGGTTGLAATVKTDRAFAIWVHIALLKPNPAMVESTWLESMLNSDYCYRQSQVLTHGIANRDRSHATAGVTCDLALQLRSSKHRLRTHLCRDGRTARQDRRLGARRRGPFAGTSLRLGTSRLTGTEGPKR